MAPAVRCGEGTAEVAVSEPEASERPLWVVRAGTVEYDEALALQERLHAARRAGAIEDTLLLLQHPAVITLGRSAHAENLLVDPLALERRGSEQGRAT